MADLIRIDGRHIDDAKALLEEAAGMEFESVIVFGMRDGQIFVSSSAHRDTLKLIGALEAAKIHLWQETDQ